MSRSVFIYFICFLFISINNVSGQALPPDKAVLSPFVDIKKLPNPDSLSLIIRNYDPFDNITMFTPTFGAQVYKNEEFYINMFAIAFVEGDAKRYKPNGNIGIVFSTNLDSKNPNRSYLKSNEIVFLVNNNRYEKNIDKYGGVFFQDPSLFLKLYKASKVRARIEGENDYYEIDMSKEVRSIIGTLIREITQK